MVHIPIAPLCMPIAFLHDASAIISHFELDIAVAAAE
jgi:hypothetical protein